MGRFLNARRRRVYPRLVAATSLVWLVTVLPYYWWRFDQDDRHYAGDFVVYWAAANVAQEDSAESVYDAITLHGFERRQFPNVEPFPWHYPPQYLLVVLPLAGLPFAPALGIWLAATGVAFAAALRLIGRQIALSVKVIVCQPAGLANVLFGQNGFLFGAAMGAGLQLVDRRPVLAGAALGVLSVKPHLAPVVIVGLIAGRRWKCLFGMSLSVLAAMVLSLLVFGSDTWSAYFRDLDDASEYLRGKGATEKIPTLAGALLLGGAPTGVALAAHAVLAAITFVVVAAVWSQPSPAGARNAATAAGALVATPYAFVYDLVLLGLALIWLIEDGRRSELATWEIALIVVATLSPFVSWGIASVTPIQIGPAVVGAVFLLAVRRARPSVLRLREGAAHAAATESA